MAVLLRLNQICDILVVIIDFCFKCAVTNALRETLLSFGGSVATELMELLQQTEVPTPAPTPCLPPTVPPEPLTENNQNIANKIEPKNAINNIRKDETVPQNMKTHHPVKNTVTPAANASRSPPVTRAHPMPCPLPATTRPPAANRLPAPLAPAALPPPPLPPAPRQPRHHPRPNSNVSFVLQPVMGAVPPLYTPPRPMLPQPLFPNYYEYAGPWHIAAYEAYERGNVNLNFNLPPKNLVVNSRSGSMECRGRIEGEALQYAAPNAQACWIKPTIFYNGFWTEQKLKKWVAEQVEKQLPEDSWKKSTSPGNQPVTTTS